ncbi:MAG TPA: DUF2189 domain-containing protein [Acetobacteraceae bacterium]|nr:DUF2189 domain-containing protein [Acetobacteraceae bacterium]
MIRNPVLWSWDALRGAAGSLEGVASNPVTAPPQVRRIEFADLRAALAAGLDDFRANPTHYVFLCAIYPVMGLLLWYLAVGYDVLPLLFPLIAGFALVGPLAGSGLYEISRRRERGEQIAWWDALGVFASPSIGGIILLGIGFLLLFAFWMAVADLLYRALLPPPDSFADLLRLVFTTGAGWALIVLGNGIGFLFAVAALMAGTFSFPLLVDRSAAVETAVATSVRAVLENKRVMATWGVIVAALLVAGSIPVLLGLAVVLPVLSHATWHLYRRTIVS